MDESVNEKNMVDHIDVILLIRIYYVYPTIGYKYNNRSSQIILFINTIT